MSVVLAIVDNLDGTGATATVQGTAALDVNEIWVQPLTGELGAGGWTLSATEQGDGPVPLPLAVGYYWAYCLSDATGVQTLSNLVYFRVSVASDPVLYRCLLATHARIAALTLAGFAIENLLIRKAPGDRDIGSGETYSFPAIQISPGSSESMDASAGTNRRDDVIYPVLVTILAADNQNQEQNFSRYLGWRERIARAFRNQPLVGVEEVYQCEISPQDIVEPQAFWRQNLYSSSLLLNFKSREPRGLAT